MLVALIAGIPATLSALFGIVLLWKQRIPSGGRIGDVTERTHQLSASSNMLLLQQLEREQSDQAA